MNNIEVVSTKFIIGTKIYFESEKRPYTVKACNSRYLICTKPFNPKKTVLYTIVDLHKGIRGRNNLIFNMYDYSIQEDINTCLNDLKSGEIEVSYRNYVKLDIIKIM